MYQATESVSVLRSIPKDGLSLRSLTGILRATLSDLAQIAVADVPMACAAGLPAAEHLNISACLATLDCWAQIVNRYVQDVMPNWRRGPYRYGNQIGFFKFLAMVSILKHPRGLNVVYEPTAIGNSDCSDSRDDFLHGVLTRRTGTCVSLPTLYVAIGRRIGWPIHLAVSKGHVFCQWVNEDGSHVNLEGSCPGGGDMLPDSYYEQYPRPLNGMDYESGVYLRPLSRTEELALFMETRGHCLADNMRFDEAEEAYRHTHRLWPKASVASSELEMLRIRRAKAIDEKYFLHPVVSPMLGRLQGDAFGCVFAQNEKSTPWQHFGS
jgi:Transglutaminase-like superfamily